GFALGDDSLSEADRLHLLAEATKSAYHVRDDFIADPAQAAVDVEGFLSDNWAEKARRQIRLDRVLPGPEWHGGTEHTDTVYLCAVDRDGNAVSFINSLFSSFGTGIMAPASGVLLQNRGTSFRIIAGHPNAIAPRKRPFHTIIPGMLVKDGRAVMPFGVMGGQYQAVGHAHLVHRVLDRGLDPQQAAEAPRRFAFRGKLRVERGVPEPEMRAALQKAALRGWDGVARSWGDLGVDTYMADGGRYRRRRFAAFRAAGSEIVRKPHQPHYQSRDYNPLNGGLERWFEPVTEAVARHPALTAILLTSRALFDRMTPVEVRPPAWHVELHQFRIEARPGEEGRPTPEGMHRDG